MSRTVLFRCDASPEIGAGHVVRCLALAETMADVGYEPVFLSAEGTSATVPAILKSGFPSISVVAGEPGAAEATLHGLVPAHAAVVDSYRLGVEAECALHRIADLTLAIDDSPSRRHDVDFVVDSTPGRTAADYEGLVSPATRVLAGGRHAFVHRAWREGRQSPTTRLFENAPVRILVSMGSTDPHDATSHVVEAVRAANIDADVDIVLGPKAAHLERVRARSVGRVTLHVEPDDFPALARAADLAVGATGSSIFERALTSLPSLVIPLFDNQFDAAAALEKLGCAEVVAPGDLTDPALLGAKIAALAKDVERRRRLSYAAAQLCDGRGAMRVLVLFAGKIVASGGAVVNLRLCEQDDRDWLLELQRLPETRRFARNPSIPTPEEHARWYDDVMTGTDKILAILLCDGERCGFVRLDRRSNGPTPIFEASIAVAPRFHRRGIGAAGLRLARQLAPGAVIDAAVHSDNLASRALFVRAGYVSCGALYRSTPQ